MECNEGRVCTAGGLIREKSDLLGIWPDRRCRFLDVCSGLDPVEGVDEGFRLDLIVTPIEPGAARRRRPESSLTVVGVGGV